MTARSLAFAALLLTAAALPQAQSPGSKPSRDWKRLVVGDLEAVGNAPERELRRALTELQRFRGTLAALLPGLDVRPTERSVLVVVRPDTFQRFTPRDGRGRKQENVGGYFLQTPDANLMVLPLMSERELTYVTAFHEYTHYLIYRNMRNVPRWLNEGIAELYSTFSVERDGRVVIGKAPPGRLSILYSRSLLPVERFLDPETSSRLFESPSDTALFYTQAWALVHFMTFGDDGNRRGQISKYLQALQSSAPADAARAAFGDLSELDAQLRRYTKQFQLPALILNVRPAGPPVPERLGALTEADVHQLHGRLLLEVGATDEAEAALKRALADDPSHPAARLTMGRVRVRQMRHEDGIALLTEVARERAEDFDAQFFLGAALFAGDRFEEALVAYDKAIALKRHSHAAWSGLSAAALALKRDAHANAAMRHALELYSDPSHYRARAQLALGLGRNDAAARDAEEYLRQAGWGDDAAPYGAFIGAIAYWRLNQPAGAEALLAKAAETVRPKSWVETVTRYLQGKLAEAAFLDAADDNGQRTEAHAYIGVRLLLAGRTDDARKHFVWVKERGDRNYTEYELAIAELKRLDRR